MNREIKFRAWDGKMLYRKVRALDTAPGLIASATAVPLPTVTQAFDKLLRLGAIERLGLGRSTRYRKLNGDAPHAATNTV